MIIVRIKGGLGNQLFQYALGLEISQFLNRKLIIDISQLNKKTHKHVVRFFSLKYLCLSNTLIGSNKISALILRVFFRIIQKTFKCNTGFGSKITYISESTFSYSRSLFNQVKKSQFVLLDGYWQSHFYSPNVRDGIYKSLINSPSMSKEFHNAYKVVTSDSYTSIHVRRGDYIKNKFAIETYCELDFNYYLKAMGFIISKFPNSKFILFTDDWEFGQSFIDIVKESFQIAGAKEMALKSDIEELVLMTGCKNNIIANSSFSYWGGLLNPNSEKIIVAPSCWFKNHEVNTQDLIPSDWFVI